MPPPPAPNATPPPLLRTAAAADATPPKLHQTPPPPTPTTPTPPPPPCPDADANHQRHHHDATNATTTPPPPRHHHATPPPTMITSRRNDATNNDHQRPTTTTPTRSTSRHARTPPMRGLADQQRLGFAREQERCRAQHQRDRQRRGSVELGTAGDVGEHGADERGDETEQRCAVFEQHGEQGRILARSYRLVVAEIALGPSDAAQRCPP